MEQQLTFYNLISRYDRPCEACGKGTYQETSIQDDWEGVLHCTKCNHEVKRRYEVWTSKQ